MSRVLMRDALFSSRTSGLNDLFHDLLGLSLARIEIKPSRENDYNRLRERPGIPHQVGLAHAQRLRTMAKGLRSPCVAVAGTKNMIYDKNVSILG